MAKEKKVTKRGQKYEEYAYVLDYLPHGRPGTNRRYRTGPLIQVIGERYFTLLEAIVKETAKMKSSNRVYVGKQDRKMVTYIIGRIGFEELTSTAKMELPDVVEKIVSNRENEFVDFFNKSQAITPRMHALELLPGIGKKYMWQVIDERERKPFKSFKDLQTRTDIPNPAKLISKRIIEELSGESKHRLFTRAS
ncbi:DUF655 domain-containing protein [Candidatus Bathyarchaeota archaeon]|nr:DUF655 domain-containing protein [Candidatus Bathyarchaeota archaeon]NIU81840.1 DUF655 domain-containing protein [Candidatus Bathyarchaeota archaeon]NIW34981.1 DUF655 domain-containing protein [Candidatus Bathyarchaeota archaeon]